MTAEAQQVLEKAELVIGARRMVEAAALEGQDVCIEYDSDKISRYIEEHPEYEKIAVVLSGDVDFTAAPENFWKSFPDIMYRSSAEFPPGLFYGKDREILG